MTANTVTPRKNYQIKLLRQLENDNALIVLGLRRSGKTCFALQMEEHLKRRYGDEGIVHYFDFETPRAVCVSIEYLIERFEKVYDPNKKNVFLMDELIHVNDWEKAANYAFARPNVKLVFFSSKRHMLSEAFDAYREGRCDIIEMLPLSMEEYIRFRGIKETTSAGTATLKKRFDDANGNHYGMDELYSAYLRGRALPVTEREQFNERYSRIVSDGTCSSVVLHDILEYGSNLGLSAVTDPALLRCIITIMANSMGSNVSATWIGKQIPDYLSRPSSTKTVESYMRALINSHLFYSAQRYDIKADQTLKTLSKYYMADISLCRYTLGKYPDSESVMLENRVFFELKRRGYEIYNGKYGQHEIKFMAVNGAERAYIQIADSFDELARRELLTPLRKIKDDHPKVIISSESETRNTTDGVMIINAAEFLMGASWNRQKTGRQ